MRANYLIILILLGASTHSLAQQLPKEARREQELLQLASESFPRILDAERELIEAIAERKPANLGPGSAFSIATTASQINGCKATPPRAANPATEPEAWGPEREVRAEFIRWLCKAPEVQKLHDPQTGIQLQGAVVTGNLQLHDIQFSPPLALTRCRIGGEVDLHRSSFGLLALQDSKVVAVHAGQLRARVLYCERMFVERGFQLINAHIEGSAYFEQGIFDGRPFCLGFDNASIGSSLRLDGCHFRSDVSGAGARVGVAINARRATFGSLYVDGLTVDGNLAFQGAISYGELRMPYAIIRGVVDFEGATLRANPVNLPVDPKTAGLKPVGKRPALNAQDAQFQSQARFVNCTICGPAWLSAARIATLSFSGSHIEAPGDLALNLESAVIEEGLFFLDAKHPDEKFTCEGSIKLLGASVSQRLDLAGVTIRNPGGNAIAAANLRVGQGLYVLDATIEGAVNLRRSELGEFHWREMREPLLCSELDLRGVQAFLFEDERESWPAAVRLDGLTYDHLWGAAPTTWAARQEWFERLPEHRTQPYEQLARVLHAMGLEREAVRTLQGKLSDKRFRSNLPAAQRAWNTLLRVTIGYGYNPWQCIIFIVPFIATGCALTHWCKLCSRNEALRRASSWDKRFGESLTSDEIAHDKIRWLVPTGAGNAVALNPLVYSIDTFVPILNLRQASSWRWRPGWIRRYFWVHRAAGWALTTVFVLGLTGLVR